MRRFRFVLVFALGLAAAAHASPPTPEEFARSADSLLNHRYRSDAPGAVVLVARGGTVLYRAARGAADVNAPQPLRPDSRFRIASVTKQFTAAGLLKLVEAGKVRLEDPVSRYVPDYPGGDSITLLQLLDHTSGIRNFNTGPEYMAGAILQDMTTKQLIDLFRNDEPDFPPGSNWAYSNSNYVLVGAVIEAVSGRPWHAYLDEVFFKPLKMKHTGYGADPRVTKQVVQGYTYDKDRVVPARPMSMTQPHAAGGLVSNADDLYTWCRALHEGRVLTNATYTRMVTPVGRAAGPGARYGFGLYVDRVRTATALRHGGSMFGFVASLSYLPGPDITVVVLENDDVPNGEDDAHTLVRKLAAQALGTPYPEPRAVPVDRAALQKAEGVYRFDGNTTRVLRVVDGALTAQRDRAPRSALTPIGPDEYLYSDRFNRILLQRDVDGRINGMRFFPRGDGEGEVGVRTSDSLPAPPTGVKLPRAAQERVVGSYAQGGLNLRVWLEGETLMAQVAGQDPVHLRAVSPVLFDVEETGATLEFPAGEGVAAHVTVRQGQREVVLKRAP